MSFADLEAGALRAPLGGRKARGGANDARGLVFQITTAVASYRRLLNSLGTPKDTPILRDHLQKTSQNILQLAKDAKDKLQKAAEADKSIDTSVSNKRVADMKLAKDFGATMEEFRKLQNLAIQREMAYKPVVPQNAQSNYTTGDRSDGPGHMPEQRALLAESTRQEVLQLDNEIVFNEALIEEREHAIQEIQQQIEEIDTNIDNSAAATKEAKKEVAQAAKTQKSNSSLLCLLMVIFGVVLLVVIIVLAA
ncbi:Syntaxin-22 [Dichanthelium oligosanthes]|uniref:Syntaxin-22 n=1 Tax=Dichanthelium oligosanthes TaxID=888268 RepID=A0A1E5W6X0_9POAL|nr:Syntaxin-22 [Dichanthelium oligosanthes]